jgi:hypothetical protein
MSDKKKVAANKEEANSLSNPEIIKKYKTAGEITESKLKNLSILIVV